MKRLLVVALLISGCINFDAIGTEACATKGLCDDSHRMQPIENVGYCNACDSELQCGGGNNLCLRFGTSPAFCGVACQADGGCAAGSECSRVRIDDGGVQFNCAPAFPFQCDGGLRPGATLDAGRDAGVDAGTDGG